ncbi:hypothetical protein P7K49_027168, partial [Saguinus oedipus]
NEVERTAVSASLVAFPHRAATDSEQCPLIACCWHERTNQCDLEQLLHKLLIRMDPRVMEEIEDLTI